jgi:hypothetical protein
LAAILGVAQKPEGTVTPYKAKKPGRLLNLCGSSTLLQGTPEGVPSTRKKLRGDNKFYAGITTRS